MNVCRMNTFNFKKNAIKKEVIQAIIEFCDLDEVNDLESLRLLKNELEENNKGSIHGGFPKITAAIERIKAKEKELESMKIEGIDEKPEGQFNIECDLLEIEKYYLEIKNVKV